VRARARDLTTSWTGATVSTDVSIDAVVTAEGARILEISSTPEVPLLQEFVGHSAHGGFRRRIAETLPDEVDRRTLLNLLLDDFPGALLVSTIARNMLDPATRTRDFATLQQADLCSGWRSGGSIMIEIDRGHPTPMVTGPIAMPLLTDDPLAWHDLPVMGPEESRRLRRIDVLPGDPAPIDAYFRDSHNNADLRETAIHEYSVAATVSGGHFVSVDATPRVLPWVECPHAAGSAAWLNGTRYDDLRRRIRNDFTGIDTCTHLNDTLRCLEDLVALMPLRSPAA
jgi:Protein of unknown function (DUF2889)